MLTYYLPMLITRTNSKQPMKKLYNLILLLLLICCTFGAKAQQNTNSTLSAQEQLRRFLKQNTMMPQERVHVVTDRNHYLSGDTIWMRAFLVDGLYKKPVHYSRFLYVELRNETDRLVRRVKLHEQPELGDSIMRGYLPTDTELPTGVYTIVAYTQWMLNGSEALFFKRNVQLVNAGDIEKNILTDPLLGTTGCDAYHHVDSVALQKADQAVMVVHPQILVAKNIYGSREKVTVQFQAPPHSSLVVSVTDNAATVVDLQAVIHYNILSQPYWHNLDSVYAGYYRQPKYLNEISQEVTGRLKSKLLRQPLKNNLVLLSSPESHLFRLARTDESGVFRFENFDMPDTVTFTVRANANKSIAKGEVILDASPLPEVVHHLEAPVKPVSRTVENQGDSVTLKKMRERARFSSGMWEISLAEVDVAGQKKVKGEDAVSRFADRKFGHKEIMEMGVGSLEDLLNRIPGITIDVDTAGNRVAKYRGKVVHFWLNDVEVAPSLQEHETEFDYVEAFCHLDCIEYLDIIEVTYLGSESMTDHNGYGIRIKDNPQMAKQKGLGIKTFKPLGYQLPHEFVQTDYSTPAARSATPPGTDLRPTLYWNPSLEVDSTGVASFSFWTNDNYNTIYTIRVEGVSEAGHLIDAIKRIKMK